MEWSQTGYIFVLDDQGVLNLKGTCGGEPAQYWSYNLQCIAREEEKDSGI